jgi:ATP-dependent phosphoenolpyruvate carboxykinase
MAAGVHPFAALVRDREGVVVESEARIGAPLAEGARFAALLRTAEPITPPVTRLADRAYLLRAGRVGGPESDPRSRAIPPALVGRVLDAAIRGSVEWERDPDFEIEVPVAFPGMEPDELLTLVPRFLYARTDRVYEYAAMVPRVRAARSG